MAQLAIKGHSTKGKEIIEILEMLGGINKYNLRGDTDEWFILNGTQIQRSFWIFEERGFTLEEFLEIFPYKVGDKVRVWSQNDDEFFYGSYSCESKTIKSMQWNEFRGKVAYTIEGIDRVFYKEELIPYKEEVNMKDNKADLTLKEETMEDKDMSEHTSEINLNHPCFDGCDKIELIIPDNWKFEQIGNKMFGVRKYPQYPKTYEECCKIVDYHLEGATIIGYEKPLLENLQQLLICRDAYWKIAGEQIGLGKLWKPDFTNNDEERYGIYTLANKVERDFCGVGDVNMILSFPTEEMRDEFYENFKELIESCKELL